MTKSKKTPAPAPARMTIEEIHARTAARSAEHRARLGRLADTMRAAMPGPGSPDLKPTPHSVLCVTCGAAFEMSAGGCTEERPERVEIPYETCIQLETLATDAGLSRSEAASRLISVGLWVLGRAGSRERQDLFELWSAIDEKPEAAREAV